MDLDDLRKHVGDDLWAQACAWAWKTAAHTGDGAALDHAWPKEVADVPHELENVFWEWDPSEWSWVERVALRFELYRAMPCYANLMYLRDDYHAFSRADDLALQRFWEEYRKLLAQPDDRLSAPVEYSLAVDYLDDRQAVLELWRSEITKSPYLQRRLANVWPDSRLSRLIKFLRR